MVIFNSMHCGSRNRTQENFPETLTLTQVEKINKIYNLTLCTRW